jgi:hypothetical protein
VDDSEEQNGSGKITLKAGNKNLLDTKDDPGILLAIEKHDIMTLINWTWDKFFFSRQMQQKGNTQHRAVSTEQSFAWPPRDSSSINMRRGAGNYISLNAHVGAGPCMCGFGHCLGPKCLEFAERDNSKKRQDAEARDKRQVDAREKIFNGVNVTKRDKIIVPADWGVSQLNTMVRCFARPADLPCKKKKSALVERYNLTKERRKRRV